jgi:hypothetical protein
MLLPFISLYSLLALFRQSVPVIILIIMAVSRVTYSSIFALFMIAAAMQLEPSIKSFLLEITFKMDDYTLLHIATFNIPFLSLKFEPQSSLYGN